MVHGDQEVTEVYANTLREKGLAAHAPNYEEVYDLLDNQMLSPGLPPEKKPEPASGGSPAYQRLEDVGRRLMEVIAHNKGGTNRIGPVRRPAPRPHREVGPLTRVPNPRPAGPGVFRAASAQERRQLCWRRSFCIYSARMLWPRLR